MSGKRAILLVIFGVLANNYMYLHDAIWNNNPELANAAVKVWGASSSQSVIALGQLGRIGVLLSVIVIGAGVYFIVREQNVVEEEKRRRASKP